MTILSNIAVSLVALLHIYFCVLEMFFWDNPLGMKSFGLKPDYAKATKTLAANQGLYNGFLAAGLLWGLTLGTEGYRIKIFFLICITIAGVYGAATANKKILYIQAIPAIITLALTLIAGI